VISLLLRCGDEFKVRIEQLKRKDATAWNPEALTSEVRAMISRLKSASAPSVPAPVPAADEDEVWKKMAQVTQLEVKSRELEVVREDAQPVATVSASSQVPSQSQAQQTLVASVVKIDAERVDSVLNLVGELVVLKSQLINRAESYSNDQSFVQLVGLVDKAVRELQDRTLSMRLTPLKSLFLKTQRVIRDLAVKLDKPVDFVMEGEETEIDRSMVEALSDPLLHLARNALDHGIENAERRSSSGKAAKGSIHLKAGYQGGRIVIELRDDGGGLNSKKIAAKAVEKGILSPQAAESMAETQIHQLIFAAGFSTAEKVTEVSGRGVGMDVVRTQVEKLKGHIDLESTEGRGTTIRISLPLTTSILDGMVISVGKQTFILPMECIIELANLKVSSLVPLFGERDGLVWHHRGKVFPVVDLRERFGNLTRSDDCRVALIDTGTRPVALLVDGLLGQSQVVLKPLDESVRTCKGLSGAAILGDGRVALVIDPVGLSSAGSSDLVGVA
jgi:two-component system chemotaxis sensor kinase CheA